MTVKDIVLVNSGCRQSSVYRGKLEHLGLGYLASMLLSQGYRIELLDANFNDWSTEETVRRIEKYQSRAIGFSLFLNNVQQTLEIIDILRKRGDRRHITLGGHHATFNYVEILNTVPGIDSIVIGEGEITLLEMVKRWALGEDWTTTPGVAFRAKDGAVKINPCQPMIADLDSLPFPYRKPYAEHLKKQDVATVISSRGCYGSCSFCSVRAFSNLAPGKPWRPRSAKNVVDEIEELVKRYGVKYIEFIDDNLIGTGRYGIQRAREIGEELIRRKVDISFLFICRANDIDEELLRFLKKAGLGKVDIGVETWVPGHLKLFNKKLTVADNQRAVSVLKKLKLANRFYLVPSNPYASIDELLQNMTEVEKVGLEYFPDPGVFNRLCVLKGSPIEDRLRQDGMLLPVAPGEGFKRPLEYNCVDQVMQKVQETGNGIYRQYVALTEKVTYFFETADCNLAEKDFTKQVNKSLFRAAFYLFWDVIKAYQKSPESDIQPLITGTFEKLEQAVAEIEKAHATGKFHDFKDIRIKVGDSVLRYPPEDVRRLTRLLKQYAKC